MKIAVAKRTTKLKKSKRPKNVGRHLIVHPGICFGKLTFKGTRVPVETIFTYLAMGDDIDDIMKGWPRVKREAVVEAIKLASAALVKNTGARSEADAEADLQVRLTRAKLANHEPVHLGRAN